jgi:Retrotransposon gag protein
MQQEHPASNPCAQRAPLTMEQLHAMLTELHGQLGSTRNELQTTQNELNLAKTQLANTQAEFHRSLNPSVSTPKRNRPPTFEGKGSVDSWLANIQDYCSASPDEQKLAIAVTYLTGSAHEWYIGTKMITNSPVLTFAVFCQAISKRFNPADKARAARDKLAKWRQLKSVHVYSQSFFEIILDIPKITEDGKIDRYSHGLKTLIWEELCTHNYTSLDELMNDAERVEAAKWRKYQASPSDQGVPRGTSNSTPSPMELGSVIVGKLTPEEREKCLRLGLCLRCRKPGYMAKECNQFAHQPPKVLSDDPKN